MKKAIVIISGFILVGLVYSFQNPQSEHKYKVEYTLPQWQNTMNVLEYAKNLIKQSDIPTKVGLPIMDSITNIQTGLAAQIQPQLPKDTTSKKP